MESNKYILGLGYCSTGFGTVNAKGYSTRLPTIRLSWLEEKKTSGEDLTNKDVKQSNCTDIIFTNVESCHRFKLLIDDCITKFEEQNKK